MFERSIDNLCISDKIQYGFTFKINDFKWLETRFDLEYLLF